MTACNPEYSSNTSRLDLAAGSRSFIDLISSLKVLNKLDSPFTESAYIINICIMPDTPNKKPPAFNAGGGIPRFHSDL